MELVPFWRRWTGTDSFLKWTFHTLLILGTCCGVLPKEVGHHCKIVYFTRTMSLLSPLSSTHPKVWTSSVAVSKGQSHFMEFPYSVPASVACLLFHSRTAKDCFVLYNPIYSRLMSQSIDSSYAWIPPNLLDLAWVLAKSSSKLLGIGNGESVVTFRSDLHLVGHC